MGIIEQVSRYDPYVNAARMETQKHFAQRSERAIRRLQSQGLADRRVDPAIAADALGSMVGRFAELWLTQGYREYDFDQALDQLSLLWANAIGLDTGAGAARNGPRPWPQDGQANDEGRTEEPLTPRSVATRW